MAKIKTTGLIAIIVILTITMIITFIVFKKLNYLLFSEMNCSFDEKYMFKTIDNYTYEIISVDNNTVVYSFVTNDKNAHVFWAKKNNDIFVLSHDTGISIYIRENNSWTNKYFMEFNNLNGTMYANIIYYEYEDDKYIKVESEYDIGNIPNSIQRYIYELPIDT